MTENTVIHVPMLWEENFLDDFRIKNPSKKVGVITWTQDKINMRLQLLTSIRDQVDVILSEVLPGDFQDNLLNEEVEFFNEHYLYVPPKILKKNKKQNTILIILDKKVKNLFWNTIITNLGKIDLVKIIYIDANYDQYDELNKQLVKSEKIFLNCSNPHISTYSILHGLVNDKPFLIDNPQIVATRLWALGITGFNLHNQDSNDISLRARIQQILDLNTQTKINSANFDELDLDFKDINRFEKFSNSKNCRDILYNLKYKNFNELTKYSSIEFIQNRENKEINFKSRFNILFQINTLENSNINEKTRESVLLELIIYLLKSQNSKHNTTVIYELIKNFRLDTELTIKRLFSCSDIKSETENFCFIIAEIMYCMSLNLNLGKEKRKYYYKSAIILLENFLIHQNKHSLNKHLLDYISSDSSSKESFVKDQIELVYNAPKTFKAKKFAKLVNVLLIKYFDLVKDNRVELSDESLQERLVIALLIKIGLPPKVTYYQTIPELRNFPDLYNDIKLCLNLGFNSLVLIMSLRHELTWQEIKKKCDGLNKIHKSLLLLHCLDKFDTKILNDDLYQNYVPDQSKYGLSIHFSIQVIINKVLNKSLTPDLVNNIISHIDSLIPTNDLKAHAFSYFLAKSVGHNSLKKILLTCESENFMYYKINAFLNHITDGFHTRSNSSEISLL